MIVGISGALRSAHLTQAHLASLSSQPPRYGLEDLIVENASALVKAVDKYKGQDNDVAVFSKILHIDIDEESMLIQRQLKDTIVELLRAQIKSKNPLKSDEFMTNALSERLNGVLQEEEWVDLIQYMYSNEVSCSCYSSSSSSSSSSNVVLWELWFDLYLFYPLQDSLALMVMIKDLARHKRAEEARKKEEVR